MRHRSIYFFQCTVVESMVNDIFKWVTGDITFEISRKELFALFSRDDLSNQKNFFLTVISKIVLKFIWDSKQRYCLPNFSQCKITIISQISSIAAIHKKFKKIYDETGFANFLV
jgi:hypothetical protein